MSNRDRLTVARDVVASIAVAGAFVAGAVGSSATAAADPPPAPPGDAAVPVPPPPAGPPAPIIGAPLGPAGFSPLAQNGSPAPSRNELLLGQNPLPLAPGGSPGTPPALQAFNNAYLLPQNVVPSAPGEGQMFDVAPGAENANISSIDYLKRLYRLQQDDRLKGGLLGQMEHSQLGAPLPGTAPPPGTAIPPGLSPPEPAGVVAPAEATPGPEVPLPLPTG